VGTYTSLNHVTDSRRLLVSRIPALVACNTQNTVATASSSANDLVVFDWSMWFSGSNDNLSGFQ